jgi:MFS family permease
VTAASQRSLTAGLVLTVACVAFEGLAVPTVMPTVAEDLGGLLAYGWAFSAFMLANLVGITVAGERIDRSGPLGALVASLALFGLGLAGGGAAQSMAMLIAARAVQGLGGGGLSAVVYACVARCYPTEGQPRMLALLSTAWVVPGLIGPGASGLVADNLTWRLVFFGLIPLLPVAAMLTFPTLRGLSPSGGPTATARATVSTTRSLLLASGSVLLLLALERRTLLSAVLLFALGAALAAPSFQALMPVGTLRARAGLPAAIAVMLLISVAFFGAETLLPLMLIVLRDQSATSAGLALSGATLAWTAGAWIQARQASRRTRGLLVAIGAGLLAAGIAIVNLVLLPAAPELLAGVGWAIAGLGMGIAHTTTSLTVIERARVGEEGAASAAMQLASSLGVALGAGVGGAAVALAETQRWAASTGFALGLPPMLAAAVATLLLAPRLSVQNEPD